MIDLAKLADTARPVAAPWPCHRETCTICNAVDRAFMSGIEQAERDTLGPIPAHIAKSQAASLGWRSRRYSLRTGAPVPKARLRADAVRIMQAAHDAGRAV